MLQNQCSKTEDPEGKSQVAQKLAGLHLCGVCIRLMCSMKRSGLR